MGCRKICAGLAIVAAGALLSTYAVSQETLKTDKQAEKEAMQKWAESSTPGAEHKKLDVFVGKWNTTFKHWMDPDSEPMVNEGNANFKWILGGRFLKGTFTGDMAGQEFEGQYTIGFNKIRNEYQSSWVCTFCTSIVSFTGEVDSSGKVFTFAGKFDDPMTGKKNQTMRSVLTVVSNDKLKEEIFTPGPDGSEIKTGEGIYIRAN